MLDLNILADDLDVIREAITSFSAYDFSADLRERMDSAHLSANLLSKRCGVKHTSVSNWRQGTEKPNSKERMKALGMALEMDEKELDEFLFKNGYPGLYIKNPYDCVTKMLLRERGGRADNLILYDETLARLQPEAWKADPAPVQDDTRTMSRAFRQAMADERIDDWFRGHSGHFRGDDSTVRLTPEMSEYIRLFIGGDSVHDLVSSGRLPMALRNPLYELLSGRAVSIRTLRENLIVLALHVNMTEEELDRLLGYARLRPVSSPETAVDIALLVTLRQAHDRYAGYELCNAQAMADRLSGLRSGELRSLLAQKLDERLPELEGLMAYFEAHADDTERAFERCYTPYGDRCIADYVRDILEELTAEGTLPAEKTAPLLQKLRRKETEP